MTFPFEVPFDGLREHLDEYVDATFGALQSEFLTMPRGEGFVEYAVFEQGYEALKRATGTFAARGKVFTLQNLTRLLDCTRLADFRTR